MRPRGLGDDAEALDVLQPDEGNAAMQQFFFLKWVDANS